MRRGNLTHVSAAVARPWLPFTLATVLLALPAAAARAAPYSGLTHSCSYTYGAGAYEDISFDGHTTCREAGLLISTFTRDGARRPQVGTRTGYTTHGVWRCHTIRRRETHGEIESTHRITCRLTSDPRGRHARVRFFYEG